MRKILLIIVLIMLSTIVFSCSVSSIKINSKQTEFYVGDTIPFTVAISGTCKTTNTVNIYVTDLITLKKETIYSGKINTKQIKLKYTPKTEGIKKIYAQTNAITNKRTFTTKTLSTTSTPITIKTPGSGRIYTAFENLYINPESFEYDIIDLNFYAINNSYTATRTSNYGFGFYFLNNDFNVTIIDGNFSECGKLADYPYSCVFDRNTFKAQEREYVKVKISKLKYNDIIYTFGSDGPSDINYDHRKTIYARPFATITNLSSDFENKKITIDYNMYNFWDVNYCKLMIDGNEVKRDYNIQTDNQFVQDLNLGTYTIDINCVTDGNHYTQSAEDRIITPPIPQPGADNFPFSLDSNFVINFSLFGGGLGTSESPFLVNTCTELSLMRDYNSSFFVLNKDIDCNGFDFVPISGFSGVLDGNGKKISNLSIDLPLENNVGLFGNLSGVVKNIGFEGVSIVGNENVGAVTGINNGLIEQIFVQGEIVGNNYVGGITGVNERVEVNNGFPYDGSTDSNDVLREINNSYTLVNVIGGVSGGIVGYNKGKIIKTYSLGTISGEVTGAIVGHNYTRCYSYTHAMRSGIISDSFSTTESAMNNSCYSNWYYGSGASEQGKITNTFVDDETYLSDPTNPPFNSWDFENVWKLASPESKSRSNPYPVLRWEQVEEAPLRVSVQKSLEVVITEVSETYSTKIDFNYKTNINPKNCSLIIDNKIESIDNITPFDSFSVELVKGEHEWSVSCIGEQENIVESKKSTIKVYETETLYYCRQYDVGQGWSDYTKYILNPINNVTTLGSGTKYAKTIASGSTIKQNSFLVETNCFTFNPNNSNIIVDCENQKITGSGNYTGALIYGANNITIKNCEFENFSNGITNINGDNILIKEVTVNSNKNTGINTTTQINIKDTIVCKNNLFDLQCSGEGSFNNLGNIKSTKINCQNFAPNTAC